MAITLRPATVGTDGDAAIDIAIKNWLLTPKLVSAERLLPEPLMKTRRSRQNQAALNPGSWLFLVAVDEEGKVVGHLDGGPAQAHDDVSIELSSHQGMHLQHLEQHCLRMPLDYKC